MKRNVRAVYRKGVLAPLEPLDLPEEQTVTITIEVSPDTPAREALAAWEGVFAGLSEDEVAETLRIALDRRRFMREPR